MTASGFINGLQGNPFYIEYTVLINRLVLAFKQLPAKQRGGGGVAGGGKAGGGGWNSINSMLFQPCNTKTALK